MTLRFAAVSLRSLSRGFLLCSQSLQRRFFELYKHTTRGVGWYQHLAFFLVFRHIVVSKPLVNLARYAFDESET